MNWQQLLVAKLAGEKQEPDHELRRVGARAQEEAFAFLRSPRPVFVHLADFWGVGTSRNRDRTEPVTRAPSK